VGGKGAAEYGADAAAHLVGITPRQVRYWALTGVAGPGRVTGAGFARRSYYRYEDVLRLALVQRLVAAGLSLDLTRGKLGCLAALPRTEEGLARAYLVSAGGGIELRHGLDEVLGVIRLGGLVVVCSVAEVARALDQRMEQAAFGLTA